ncbi:MAG: DUF3365 domain-containing protein [Bacteroidota bacterium]|nr:DUF3365 domain-containing protein [Bacteroidota bacterium]
MIKYTWWIFAIWTFIMGGLLLRDIVILKQATQNLAIREARAHFQKDEAFRFWSATHGGFYVPVDERTPPSPYLAHISERDIETPSGVQLTLMNPAYAVRQMNEDFAETYGVAGHITSLLPLRPENAPDNWEKIALESFERGESEVLEFTNVEGQPFLRLMQPLITQEGCLKCHAHQGYEVGDVRGGVSVELPLAAYAIEEKQSANTHTLSFALIWLVGFGIIIQGSRVVKKSNIEKDHAYKMMKDSYGQLERGVKERTAELAQTNQDLQNEITIRAESEESNTRMGRILDDSLNEIYIFDTESFHFTQVNRGGRENLGYTLEEFKTMTPLDIVPEFSSDEFDDLFQPLRDGSQDKIVFETIHKRKDGSTYPIKVHLQLTDMFYVAVISDLTERKQAEKILSESEERYLGIIQSTASCIAVFKPIGNGQNFVFVEFNPMAEKIEKISKDEVIGKKVTEVFPGVVDFGLFKVFQDVWRTGDPVHFPVSVYQDKRIQGYRENYVYKLPSGEIVSVYQDLTEGKLVEEELASHRANLEEMVEARTLEVEQKNKELNNAMKVFVGRELTIRDLQKRIVELGG